MNGRLFTIDFAHKFDTGPIVGITKDSDAKRLILKEVQTEDEIQKDVAQITRFMTNPCTIEHYRDGVEVNCKLHATFEQAPPGAYPVGVFHDLGRLGLLYVNPITTVPAKSKAKEESKKSKHTDDQKKKRCAESEEKGNKKPKLEDKKKEAKEAKAETKAKEEKAETTDSLKVDKIKKEKAHKLKETAKEKAVKETDKKDVSELNSPRKQYSKLPPIQYGPFGVLKPTPTRLALQAWIRKNASDYVKWDTNKENGRTSFFFKDDKGKWNLETCRQRRGSLQYCRGQMPTQFSRR